MNRLPELIIAYLSMDTFARNVIVDAAKTYARTRPFSPPRAELRLLPRSLNNHSAPDGIGDSEKKSLVSISSHAIDED